MFSKFFLEIVLECPFVVYPEPELVLLGSVSYLKTAHIPINMMLIR